MKESILSTQAIVIFGGENGWGKKIADICQGVARAVTIVDQGTSGADAHDAIAQADTIFLAAPDTEIGKILDEHRSLLRAKILLDCATNKSDFADALKEIAQDCDVCSTHPMIRSETPSRGQNVLLMPLGKEPERAKAIATEIFQRLEMDIHDFDFEKHAELMSILQFVPHMIQRVLIGALGQILHEKEMTLHELGQLAPANFLVTELGIGRVGIQRPSVSAGIIVEALKTDFGRSILHVVQSQLAELGEKTERSTLEQKLSKEIDVLDSDNVWRKRMEEKTDVMIEAMGNLKARSFQLLSSNDKPGLLKDVCTVLADRNINMTAMHSHRIESDTGQHGVRFDIGIDDVEVDWQGLEEELNALGLRIMKEKT